MKRIKPMTRRLPRKASTHETSNSPKLYCTDMDQAACEADSGCEWVDGTCVAYKES